jgi:pyruvate-formate lyase-activating enzyme
MDDDVVEGSGQPIPLGATTFAFHVTYTCPLSCAHCCFGSSPSVRDTLDPELILNCIEGLPSSLKLVAFTGGEPFLHNRLADYVGAARRRGFRTRVVTSAYFGKTYASAKKRLQPLIDAGLNEISMSWDDYHEEYVDFACIKNVAKIAIEAGLITSINSVVAANTIWNREKVIAELGDMAENITLIRDSHLNLTGRGEGRLQEAGFQPTGFLGPCPYVLTGPTLSAKGKLLACCGVIPDTKRLAISERVQPAQLGNAIEQSFFQSAVSLAVLARAVFACRTNRRPPRTEHARPRSGRRQL